MGGVERKFTQKMGTYYTTQKRYVLIGTII